MLAAVIWHNVLHSPNVNADVGVTALDALMVINELNSRVYSDSDTSELVTDLPDEERPPYYDVNCDGHVTALDALLVINTLNDSDFYPGFEFDSTSNDVALGFEGSYEAHGCHVKLTEGTSLRTELTSLVVLPAENSGVRLHFDTPEFDTSSTGSMQDSFEVTVTDLDGNRVTQPYAFGRTAALNWSEDSEGVSGAASVLDSGSSSAGAAHDVVINLAHLAAGTEVIVTARLVNNDGDDNSSIVVHGIEPVTGLELPPLAYEGEPIDAVADRQPLVLEDLADVSSSIQAEYGRTSYTSDRSQVISDLIVTNHGNQAVTGQMIVVLDRFSDVETFVMSPDGLLPDGRPYFDLTGYMDGALEAGASTRPREIRFTNPGEQRFEYRLTTLGDLNAAPSEFSTTPGDKIEAGRTYRYVATAIDEDDQSLSYSIVSGPSSLTIDPDRGHLNWDAMSDDIGRHSVTLRATDPYGLFVEQRFAIEVLDSLQNRPPSFVTDPVTDAIASSGFEVTTIATGSDPAGVGVVSGFQGPRIVTANAGDQTIGVHAGENNDRFDEVTFVSTGEPQPTGDVIAGGYMVDVNLPPQQTSGDRFDVHGLDQADLNGDGILDLVAITYYGDGSTPGRTDHYQVVAMLGDGNGNFGQPNELVNFEDSNNPTYKHLVLGDLDNDDEPDITLIRQRAVGLNVYETSLFTLLGNGDGTFSDASEDIKNARVEGEIPLHDLKLVDLDQDGNLDVVGRDSNNTQIGWRAGNGDGTFESFVGLYEFDESFFPTLERPYDIADMDRDGDLDIVAGELLHTNILFNDGDQNFSKVGELAGASPQTVSIADFSGDQLLDVFVGLRSGDGILFVGDSTMTSFTDSGQVIPLDSNPANPVGSDQPVDVDGDGDLDLLLATGSDLDNNYSIHFLENLGDGTLEVHQYSTTPLGHAGGALVGDYNGDGVNDLAHYTTDRSSTELNGVGILPGIRPGEFGGVKVNTIAFTTNEGVVVDDFDGDGILDYVLPAYAETYLGHGDGTFEAPIPAYSIPNAGGLARAADFNGDGILDLLSFNGSGGGGGSSQLVLLGIGDGTFEIGFNGVSDLFYGPSDLDVADVNNDGFLDYVQRSNTNPNVVDVILNDPANPGRNFTLSQRIDVEARGENAFGFGSTVAVADFDEDGIVDLVINEQTSEESTVKLQAWRGNGDGTFAVVNEQFDYPDQTAVGRTIRPYIYQTGDLNEDGHLDLVQITSNDARVQLGNGDLTFGMPVIYPMHGTERGLEYAHLKDFDDDGHLDLIYHDPRGFILYFRPGNGDGTFGELSEFRNNFSGGEMAFGDLDNDGHSDMLFMNGNNPASLGIFFGNRDTLVDLTTVDLDGDGNEEVLAVNQQNDRVKLFVGDNLGGLTRQEDLFTGRGPVAIHVADLDDDEQQELITVNRTGRSISVFAGSLEDGYTSTEIAVGQSPIEISSGDIDADGNVDLLVIDEALHSIWVLAGTTTGDLSDPVAVPLGDQPGQISVVDATGDGRLDAVVTLPLTNRIMILAGDGAGDFAAPVYVSTGDGDTNTGAADVAVTDLNEDGNPDLIATIPDQGVVSVFYGRGQNQFAKVQNIRVGDRPGAIELADADEDGRVDLVVSNTGDDTVSVIYNRLDPNEVYRYDSDAIDPDDDPLTYEIVDGPGGMFVNSQTGEVFWAASPDQVGQHDVTVSADDGRGGVATQSFKIDVQPARDNSPPLIATDPPTQIGAGDSLTHAVTALDDDNDTLRYRLIDGPEGAVIDPVSGELTWDGRTAAVSLKPYESSSTSGRIEAPVAEAPRPASITVEGWYSLTALTASNGATALFEHLSDSGHYTFLVQVFGNRELQLLTRFEDSGTIRTRFDFIPEVDRWYHIAMTVDDTTKLATLFVDGNAIGSVELPSSLEYGEERSLQIGGASTRSRVENVRVWNVARSAAEIQEGLTQHYDGNPNLLLDYRFEDLDTISIRDFSDNGHQGRYFPTAIAVDFMAPYRGPGLTDVDTYPFTVVVEDGRGGFDTQTFDVQVLPELRGSIAGHLFEDLNGDGDQDDGSESGVPAEPSLAGWQLFIDTNGNAYPDPSEPQTLTDVEGNYWFDGLLPGEYPVRVSPVAGYDVPTAATNVAVTASTEATFDSAIERLSLSHLRGRLETESGEAIAYWKAYADIDGDGTRDEHEPMAMSDQNGNYALTGLDAGTYTIRPDVPAGWTDTAGRDGLSVTLAVDEVLADNDFVLQPTNTSVTGGVHFVTMPATNIEARQTFRYASVATGVTDEAITYDLSLAPDGMTVDPSRGLVAWRPSINQVGEHLVILRATNASGSISLHDFYLNVTAPNTPPVILNQPLGDASQFPAPTEAYAGFAYAHDIIAQDAETTELTYALTQSPAGATIDTDSGRLDWTPAASAVGQKDFTVEVSDGSGSTTTATWTVDVLDTTPTILPLNMTLPRLTATVATGYLSRISAVDQIGRPVTWSIASGPTGLSIDADGTIHWTPTASQLGDQIVELTATTADDATETVSLDIEVVGFAVNAVPVIESTPVTSVSLGQTFEYDVLVADADRDIFAFTLLEAPVGMSVHPSLGTIRWTPSADQLGESNVLIQVSDPSGATDEQAFQLKVSRFGGPPRIVSVPPTEASVGAAFLHSVDAIDRENDPLTYSLLAAPAGMTIVETTGEVSWTPAADQTGEQDVVIQVSDGIGGASTQAFVVLVSDGVPNLPPTINSSSPRFGAVGEIYSYAIDATDPEDAPLTYSVGQGPAGLTIDAATGVATWTPEVSDIGQTVITLVATDAGGASAIESFQFDVIAANQAPVINSTAPIEVTARNVFSYDVLASDADVDVLRYELTEAPEGAAIDVFGRIRWATSVALIGSHDFSVRVVDVRGGESTQSFTLAVVEDTVAPRISLSERPIAANQNVRYWEGPFTVYARAVDDVAVASLTLSANGHDIPLSAAGIATFTFEDWTYETINATATATDLSGNVTTKTISFGYNFSGEVGGTNEDLPTAEITTPTQDSAVTGMVSIVGTAADEDFAAYKLLYRRFDELTFTEFASSNTAVTDGELGVWDTSLLLNDQYIIRLEVAATTGAVNIAEHSVGLAGELKLGNFQLSFTDMVIPVAGIPIEITRIYDTLQADREGDFGYGWRLEYRDTDLRVGLPESGLEDIGIYSALRPGVKVYLNVPGEGRQGFTFNPEIRVLPGFGDNNLVLARPRFTPDPGVTSQLSTGVSQYLLVNEQGELHAPGGIPYNPVSPDFGGAYVLTTQDGIAYRIDGSSGKLQSATDRNGNQVRFTETGILGQAGVQIDIHRDSQERVVAINDLDGNQSRYEYNSAGELSQSIDREGNQTTYRYLQILSENSREHYLDEVVDPLGRVGAKAIYGDDGRLTSLVNVNGIQISLVHDLENSQERIVDGNGNPEFLEYNNFGSVTSLTNALGHRTEYEYDSTGNRIAEIDALGNRSEYTYDSAGNVTRVRDATGQIISYTYDSLGNQLQSTGPTGQTVTATYDDRGNLISASDGQGQVLAQQVDDDGNIVLTTNARGDQTHHAFDDRGNQISETDLNGLTRIFQYDANGLRVESHVEQVIDGQSVTLVHTDVRDRNGRVTGSVDALGSTFTQTLDANGNIQSVTNQSGRTIEISDHDRPVPETFTFADQSTTRQEYDANNNVVKTVDQNGAETLYQYDAVNNLVATIAPDDTPNDYTDNPTTRYEYDALGNQVASIDPNGNRTEFEFDVLGRRTLVRDALGGETRYQYDSLGNVSVIADALGNETKFEFDISSQPTRTLFADGTQVQNVYNSEGQLISRTDANGYETRFELNPVGQVVAVVDADGGVTQFEYDEFGNLVIEEDALGNRIEHQYDALSQRVATIYPDGNRQQFTYDASSLLIAQTDLADNLATHDYDALGRRIMTTYADGSNTRFEYDSFGRMTRVIDQDSEQNERTTTWTYDERGLLTERTEADSQSVAYDYDQNGNLITTTSAFQTTSYQYDALNRLIAVVDGDQTLIDYSYDALGRITQLAYHNGIIENRTYDSVGRLLAQTSLADGSELLAIQYAYDADGNTLSKTVSQSGTTTESSFEYDRLNRLTREHVSIDGGQTQVTSYRYDAAGNRIEKRTGNSVVSYSYDQNNRLLAETTSLAGSQITTYSYDANGQLLQQSQATGASTTFDWDLGGRLQEVTLSDGNEQQQVRYQYSGDGLRTERIVTDGVGQVVDQQRMLWQVVGGIPQIIAEYSPAGESRREYAHGDAPVAYREGSELRFYHQDLVDSTTMITGPDGGLVEAYRYDAFGNPQTSRTVDQPVHFAGEFVDPVTNLVYLRARDYDSSTGRFLSIDPLEGSSLDPMSRHDYVYSHSNPLRFTDPTGQTSLAEQTVKTTIVSTLAMIGLAGLQQIHAHAIGGDPVNWQGLTGSLSFGATWGPKTGVDSVTIGATGGVYFGASLVASSPYTRTGEDQQSYGAALAHIGTYSGLGAGYSPFEVGLGVGSISVDVPGAQWVKDLGSAALAPFYAILADVNVSAGPGLTPYSKLWMGFGNGSADGKSIGNSVGVSLTFVGAITIPLPSVGLEQVEYNSWKAFVKRWGL
ncbi:tRNA nuclease WapA precursor [Allorhodopirellula solitaria]|uniref:tRNA nuclease WapA n=2 Tax=Allorhodopirellula solitaria TaxID=2527987 RepID=A0A5C5X0D4_9BACT|nr:tRNA nuclease WapA precursor [Allorhodopirellula solitaria]